jgi:hypothetical protein
VLEVARNRIAEAIPRELSIGREATAPPLPDGRFSISLARYCSVGSGTTWQVYVAGLDRDPEWSLRLTGWGPATFELLDLPLTKAWW